MNYYHIRNLFFFGKIWYYSFIKINLKGVKKEPMKNKFIALLFATCMMLSVTACGSGTETNTDTNTQQAQTQKEEQKEEQKEVADDGSINFTADEWSITYIKHEVSTDYDGNPCLFLYYTYTNNGEEASSAGVDTLVQVFQNGVECETAFVIDNVPESFENSMKDIQPGYSIEVCEAYSLTDMSDVTIEVSDWVSFSNEKDVQVIVLE